MSASIIWYSYGLTYELMIMLGKLILKSDLTLIIEMEYLQDLEYVGGRLVVQDDIHFHYFTLSCLNVNLQEEAPSISSDLSQSSTPSPISSDLDRRSDC